MRTGIQNLGWFGRRVPDPFPTMAFYRDVLGLPGLRGRNNSHMYWCGDTTVLWIAQGGTTPPRFTDRAQTTVTPILRVHGMDSVIAKLVAAGAPIINDFSPEGYNRLVYFLDPSGHVTGLQERSRESPRSVDIESWRRWDTGEPSVPGLSGLPSWCQALDWVTMRVVDVPKQLAFYRDVLGLTEFNSRGAAGAMLHLGETALLDLQPGGVIHPAPTHRDQVNNAMLLRAHGVRAIADRLKAHGVTFVNEPFDGSGVLCYFLDPEGNMVGLQERYPDSDRLEDQEADRRWAALTEQAA